LTRTEKIKLFMASRTYLRTDCSFYAKFSVFELLQRWFVLFYRLPNTTVLKRLSLCGEI